MLIEFARKSFLTAKIFWTLLAVVSLFLSLLLGLLLWHLQGELNQQQREYREGMTWIVTQVEREGLVFLYTVQRFQRNPDQETYNKARLMFDVFWSRVHGLDKGEVGEFLSEVDGVSQNVDEIKEAIRQLDVMVTDMATRPQEIGSTLVNATWDLLPKIHLIANRTSEVMLRQVEAKRERFGRLYSRALWLLAGTMAATGVLILLILRQHKVLKLLTRKLEHRVKLQSADLRSSRQKVQLLSQAVEQSPVSVFICNEEGKIEYVNEQFEKISGYSADEVIGKNPSILKSGKTPDKIYETMWHKLREGKEWRGEICNRRKNGELYWELISISPIVEEEGGVKRYLAIQEDITQRKHNEEKLMHLASHDALTQLPNRVLAMDRLEQAIRRAQRNGDLAGLLFIDLDNFKQINDTLGHDGGDHLLKNAALRLASCLRSCDTAARFGGDEFIVILSDLKEKEDALQIIRRIVNAFSKPFNISDVSVSTTTSIGVSFSPDDGTDPSLLLKNADSAMYIAKNEGKSHYRVFGEGRGNL